MFLLVSFLFGCLVAARWRIPRENRTQKESSQSDTGQSAWRNSPVRKKVIILKRMIVPQIYLDIFVYLENFALEIFLMNQKRNCTSGCLSMHGSIVVPKFPTFSILLTFHMQPLLLWDGYDLKYNHPNLRVRYVHKKSVIIFRYWHWLDGKPKHWSINIEHFTIRTIPLCFVITGSFTQG